MEQTLRQGTSLGQGNDPRYTPTSCFETFPFPRPTQGQADEVAKWAKHLDNLRSQLLEGDDKLTLTKLYNDLDDLRSHRAYPLLIAHERLDEAVAAAYGWEWPLGDEVILERLLALNLERVDTWVSLADDALRRRATTAANSRDADELWGLLEAYQTAERGGLASRHTRRSYRTGLRVLLEAWQGVNLLRPPAQAAENYRLALSSRLGPASVNLRLAAARALYRALRWSRATEADPFRDLAQVHDPVAPADKCRPFSFHDPAAGESETLRRSERDEAELEQLLEAAGPENPSFHPADRVVILLGAHAGLRRSEMERLRWRDIDSSTAQVIVHGKGGTLKAVALSDRLLEALSSLRASGGPKEPGLGSQERLRAALQRQSGLSAVRGSVQAPGH